LRPGSSDAYNARIVHDSPVLALLFAAVALTLLACDRSASEKPAGQAAAEVELLDNADGTVTDPATGLTWEKKCDCRGTPHHFEATYFWSGDGAHETIWDWLEAINGEGAHGFAGHRDWRIPNVKELMSLVDYARSNPAVAPVLALCEAPCPHPSGPSCGCTSTGPYWTSTTFADFPAHALVVGFGFGGVDDRPKTMRGLVRAVRGPARAAKPSPEPAQ
jgi:hypothetical protein